MKALKQMTKDQLIEELKLVRDLQTTHHFIHNDDFNKLQDDSNRLKGVESEAKHLHGQLEKSQNLNTKALEYFIDKRNKL